LNSNQEKKLRLGIKCESVRHRARMEPKNQSITT
jgi:hypothetical protein